MNILDEHSKQIANYITNNTPVAITKIGTERLHTLNHYMHFRTTENLNDGVKNGFYINSGVFPKTTQAHNKACRLMLQSLLDITHLSIGATPTSNTHDQQNPIYQTYRHLGQIYPQAIEPFRLSDPWTRSLKDKKVLVAHPFRDSILKQFDNRENVWGDRWKDYNNFNLVDVLQLPMSYHLYDDYPYPYENWCDMVCDIKTKMLDFDFDVFICGGGAMSLPLCAFARSMGSQAIDLGGGSQLLFGIKGSRWNQMDHVNKFFNEHWINPSERPGKQQLVERGCYW